MPQIQLISLNIWALSHMISPGNPVLAVSKGSIPELSCLSQTQTSVPLTCLSACIISSRRASCLFLASLPHLEFVILCLSLVCLFLPPSSDAPCCPHPSNIGSTTFRGLSPVYQLRHRQPQAFHSSLIFSLTYPPPLLSFC